MTFTATDTTDGVVVDQQAAIPLGVPPAASAGINAARTDVTANGTSATTITVTLTDALNRPTPGKLITISQGSGRPVATTRAASPDVERIPRSTSASCW